MKNVDFFSFSLYKTWNKKQFISEKMASSKMFFIKIKDLLILMKYVRIKLSHKKSYGKDSFKYFIGYRHEGNTFASPMCVQLCQMNAYTKYFYENNKYINLLVSDKKNIRKIF